MVKRRIGKKAPNFAARRRAAFKRSGVGKTGALLVSRQEDVFYLSGFTGHDSMLLVGRSWEALVTDMRYSEQAGVQCPDVEIVNRVGPMMPVVVASVKARKARKIAIQSMNLTAAARSALAGSFKSGKVIDTSGVVAELRTIKTDEEVRAITRSARVAEKAFKEMLAQGAKAFAGRTERDVAAELNYRMCLNGASGASFDTIVAAGPHASHPHYQPGSTVIRLGQQVLIDWGAKVNEYCSDLTRVVFVGKIPPKIGEMYEIVRRAQSSAISAIRAGVSCKTVDAAARNIIEKTDFAGKFGHGLGHGLGLQVHEFPGLAKTVKTRLRSGMVVTVEPGIYVPGTGGVRIEDDVLVTATGRRRLSSLTRDIAAMVVR